MIARHFLMQVPPDPLDRVAVRAAPWQELQLDPIPMIPEVDHHRLALVELGVVADHVDLPVPSQPTPQVVQVGQEQGLVASLLWLALGEKNPPAAPVDRAGEVPLLVVSRRLDLGLLPRE